MDFDPAFMEDVPEMFEDVDIEFDASGFIGEFDADAPPPGDFDLPEFAAGAVVGAAMAATAPASGPMVYQQQPAAPQGGAINVSPGQNNPAFGGGQRSYGGNYAGTQVGAAFDARDGNGIDLTIDPKGLLEVLQAATQSFETIKKMREMGQEPARFASTLKFKLVKNTNARGAPYYIHIMPCGTIKPEQGRAPSPQVTAQNAAAAIAGPQPVPYTPAVPQTAPVQHGDDLHEKVDAPGDTSSMSPVFL